MIFARGHRTAKRPIRQLDETGRLRVLINAVADAIIYTNPNGRILMYNSAALNLIDTNTNLTGKAIDDVLPLMTDTGKKILPSSLVGDARLNRSDLLYSYDSEGLDRINVDLMVTPMRANFGSRGDGLIFIVRDITKAKSLDEEREEFISVVSHELRTPVAVTEGTVSNAQLMLERGFSADRLKEALDEAHTQILYLASMVNELSTLSRAERGVYDTPEDIVVEDLLSELYNEYAPQASAKGLTLNLDAGPKLGVLFVSKLYLAEMLQNFITNAIKYSPEGTIVLGATRAGEAVTFSVKDSGIGISTSDQKKIFQKFYRSEDYRTRETNGTGLGLYVTKKLADKLNTTITVKSRLNHGSTFTFSIKNSRGHLSSGHRSH
jgi:PAS domain S-box-containing protein